MYIPEIVYNRLPTIWICCAIGSIFLGPHAVFASVMFAVIHGTVLCHRGKAYLAMLPLSCYIVFLFIVAASPKIGIW